MRLSPQAERTGKMVSPSSSLSTSHAWSHGMATTNPQLGLFR